MSLRTNDRASMELRVTMTVARVVGERRGASSSAGGTR